MRHIETSDFQRTAMIRFSMKERWTKNLYPMTSAPKLRNEVSYRRKNARMQNCIAAAFAVFALHLGGMARAADYATLFGKHIVGYQGWFGCPSDSVNPGWLHWVQAGKNLGPRTLRVDLWPDLSEFDSHELCLTGMMLPTGEQAFLFSSENAATVRRHFRWMREYNIDGAAIQRFVGGTVTPGRSERYAIVLGNIRAAAEAEHRGFYIMYDVSGADAVQVAQTVAIIKKDWTQLTQQGLTASPSYMHHRGKPVVAVWGLGVIDRSVSAADAAEIIRFFKEDAKVTLVGGVPAKWRTLRGDSHTEPEWAAVYRSFDVLSPWTVGRYRNPAEAEAFAREVTTSDIAEARKNGQEYMPVIFPGFSWHNLQGGAAPLDQIPRRCGAFYQAQVDAALTAGATMLYTAMFDELDEGTAILKLEQKASELPSGAELLIPDRDGCNAGNDLYLHLAGEATRALRARALQGNK
jgi:hypothetical protein